MKSFTQLARHEGNETLFEVIEMTIISMLWDIPLHIHAEGLRGTGKTTIMRAACQIMPPIVRIKECLYNCEPVKPHCPHHKDLSKEEILSIGSEVVPRPFLEISHSAKIGTIAGSIDLAKITNAANPTAAILPGIIPQAHRGIIFIDEINRLADTSPEITDILLDLMGTKPGRVQIEETGLPVVEIPVQASVWAASNPDEEPGPLQEIRRQLSDRFDLLVEMGRSKNAEEIAEILIQSEQRRQGKEEEILQKDAVRHLKRQQEFDQIHQKYAALTMPDYLRNYIARSYVKYNLESFRAIEAIQHCAILNCALRGGDQVLISDILKVIPLALKHRVDIETLTQIMNSSDRIGGESKSLLSFAMSKPQKAGITEVTAEQEQRSTDSVLSPIKGFFSSKRDKQSSNHNDPVKASPLNKAKRLEDLNFNDAVKTEAEIK